MHVPPKKGVGEQKKFPILSLGLLDIKTIEKSRTCGIHHNTTKHSQQNELAASEDTRETARKLGGRFKPKNEPNNSLSPPTQAVNQLN